jgi:ubiquinone/menaquinone biosynthesis C-methylase UbiE
MSREAEVNGFISHDLRAGIIIESSRRRAKIKEYLLSAVKTHAPATAVKLGAGEGELACALAAKVKKLIIVDPCFDALTLFQDKYKNDPAFGKIDCVNGSFFALPVDFFKADLVVITDYLDLADSYRTVDEIVRILRHEGILFFGGVVLDDEDVEGIYDEFVHAANPFHNDYYLQSDLDTFMRLKDFSKVSADSFRVKLDLGSWLDSWVPFAQTGSDPARARSVISENADLFSSLYGWDGKSSLDEICTAAVFRKNSYTEAEHKI